jgi:hypothetical protein
MVKETQSTGTPINEATNAINTTKMKCLEVGLQGTVAKDCDFNKMRLIVRLEKQAA